MELELNREHINHHELLQTVCICQEETLETIVPDACPDILRIVEAGGQLCLNEKELQEGSASVRGTMIGWLLYQPENGERLCKIDFKLPFTAKTDAPGSTSRGTCVCRPVLRRVDARMLNPRKVLIRADICVEVLLYEPKELSVCCGVEDGTRYGIEQLTQGCHTYLTTALKEKEFSVYEEVHVPVGLDGSGELLCLSADARCTEARMIGSRLIFKGEAGVRLRSLAGEQMSSVTIPVSFSQVMELEGAGDQANCTVSLYVTNVTCTQAGEDGRQLNLTLDLVGQGSAAETRPLVMLQDAYSTCGDLSVELQNLFVTDLLEQYKKPHSMRELLETQVQAKSIIDASVRVCHTTVTGTTMQTQLQAEVLYVDESDQLYSISRTIEQNEQLELPEGCICQMSSQNPAEVFTAITAGGIEVRFNLEFCGCVTRKIPMVTLDRSHWTQCDSNTPEQHPSVVMRTALPGERLWDIAKAYRTTIRRICQANEFEQEEVPLGTMLLIPASK